jgi:uncharacterized protein
VSMPVRTCVGCAERELQATLVRVVVSDGRLVPDRARRAPGRGAYLHPRAECWAAFARRRGPVRSLRHTPTPADRERLVSLLRAGSGTEIER